MGAILKLADTILFIFFIAIAISTPLLDSQTIFPLHYIPHKLLDLKDWYAREYGDYLILEKPSFYVGLIWLQHLFQWPLSLVNMYGVLTSKSWYPTTCLIYGVSVSTSMVALLSELIGSGKAPDKLIMLFISVMGLSILAILRALVPHSGKATSDNGERLAIARKKRA